MPKKAKRKSAVAQPARALSPEGRLAVQQVVARKGASGAPLDGPQMIALALVEVAEALREHTEAYLWSKGSSWRRV